MINSEAQKATILNVNSVPQHATIDVKYLSQSRNKKIAIKIYPSWLCF